MLHLDHIICKYLYPIKMEPFTSRAVSVRNGTCVSQSRSFRSLISQRIGRCRATNDRNKDIINDCGGLSMDRRMLMAAIMSVVGAEVVVPGARAEEQYEAFFGTAAPPTSYGGYGGNAEEDAKYTFEYPAGWKPSVPNKTEKGTQGIDCRITNVRAVMSAITVCA